LRAAARLRSRRRSRRQDDPAGASSRLTTGAEDDTALGFERVDAPQALLFEPKSLEIRRAASGALVQALLAKDTEVVLADAVQAPLGRGRRVRVAGAPSNHSTDATDFPFGLFGQPGASFLDIANGRAKRSGLFRQCSGIRIQRFEQSVDPIERITVWGELRHRLQSCY
jgi:hypothetical protein